jgi:CRP-like cAMP-binding protein
MLSQDLTQLIVMLRSLITLPEDEASKAANLFQAFRLKQGDFFVRAGEVPKTIGVVISGILRLYYVDLDGNESIK